MRILLIFLSNFVRRNYRWTENGNENIGWRVQNVSEQKAEQPEEIDG